MRYSPRADSLLYLLPAVIVLFSLVSWFVPVRAQDVKEVLEHYISVKDYTNAFAFFRKNIHSFPNSGPIAVNLAMLFEKEAERLENDAPHSVISRDFWIETAQCYDYAIELNRYKRRDFSPKLFLCYQRSGTDYTTRSLKVAKFWVDRFRTSAGQDNHEIREKILGDVRDAMAFYRENFLEAPFPEEWVQLGTMLNEPTDDITNLRGNYARYRKLSQDIAKNHRDARKILNTIPKTTATGLWREEEESRLAWLEKADAILSTKYIISQNSTPKALLMEPWADSFPAIAIELHQKQEEWSCYDRANHLLEKMDEHLVNNDLYRAGEIIKQARNGDCLSSAGAALLESREQYLRLYSIPENGLADYMVSLAGFHKKEHGNSGPKSLFLDEQFESAAAAFVRKGSLIDEKALKKIQEVFEQTSYSKFREILGREIRAEGVRLTGDCDSALQINDLLLENSLPGLPFDQQQADCYCRSIQQKLSKDFLNSFEHTPIRTSTSFIRALDQHSNCQFDNDINQFKALASAWVHQGQGDYASAFELLGPQLNSRRIPPRISFHEYFLEIMESYKKQVSFDSDYELTQVLNLLQKTRNYIDVVKLPYWRTKLVSSFESILEKTLDHILRQGAHRGLDRLSTLFYLSFSDHLREGMSKKISASLADQSMNRNPDVPKEPALQKLKQENIEPLIINNGKLEPLEIATSVRNIEKNETQIDYASVMSKENTSRYTDVDIIFLEHCLKQIQSKLLDGIDVSMQYLASEEGPGRYIENSDVNNILEQVADKARAVYDRNQLTQNYDLHSKQKILMIKASYLFARILDVMGEWEKAVEIYRLFDQNLYKFTENSLYSDLSNDVFYFEWGSVNSSVNMYSIKWLSVLMEFSESVGTRNNKSTYHKSVRSKKFSRNILNKFFIDGSTRETNIFYVDALLGLIKTTWDINKDPLRVSQFSAFALALSEPFLTRKVSLSFTGIPTNIHVSFWRLCMEGSDSHRAVFISHVLGQGYFDNLLCENREKLWQHVNLTLENCVLE